MRLGMGYTLCTPSVPKVPTPTCYFYRKHKCIFSPTHTCVRLLTDFAVQGAGGQGALYVRVTLIRVKAFGAHKPNAQQLGTPAVEEAIVDVYVSLGLPEWLVQE